ncbi:MAG: hypothetical protein HC822_14660 [Oscillochloris sp.]|nr:hypothetical protein [Oscillochloris sp.]
MQMSMGMGMEQQMRASPALVALNNMLVLNALELEQLVRQELADNPALEQIEAADLQCEICGRLLQDSVCYACLRADQDLWAAEREFAAADREIDPLLSVPAPASPIDLLSSELRLAVGSADLVIAEYLAGSLNEHGFLECAVADLADQLGVAEERISAVLRLMQEIGPPGIGACSTQECLLLQIDRLDPPVPLQGLLRTVVSEYWDDFAAHRYTELSRTLGVSYQMIEQVRDIIRTCLHPYPLAQATESGGRTAALQADVVIYVEHDQFLVDVAESRRLMLRLNPLYQELSRAVGKGQAEASAEETEHLRSHVSRARLFLKNMRHRRATIQRITEYVISRQEDFLRHGIRHLQPLTRTEVGIAVELNESTVSRATAKKFVQLPNREVIPYSTFFSASLSVKDVLKEIVAGESQPLTDDEIVDLLRVRGFELARRTIAKYRGQLGIPPSTLR